MPFEKRSLANFHSTPFGTASKTINWYGYATPDAAATVLANGYFNDARDKLKVNDVIYALTVANGVGDKLDLIVTAVPASGNVTVVVNGEAAGS